MLNDITLGQFFPVNSIIHRIDPRVKLMLTLFLITALFMVKNFMAYTVFAVFIAAIIIMSRVPISFIFKGLKPLLFIVVFTAVMNVFLSEGTVWFKIGFITATYDGLYIALMMIIRLFFLVNITTLLTLTTSPIMLTDGMESLLNPLKVIKVPAHELAMMMTIALRFIPTLLEETDKIIKAQSARGADFTTGNIMQRAKAMIPILVPLFISAFRRADELAIAMECRCYRGGENRTRLKQLHVKQRDYVGIVVVGIVFALIIFINRF